MGDAGDIWTLGGTLLVVEFDGQFLPGDYTRAPRWNKERPVIPYKTQNGVTEFLNYPSRSYRRLGDPGWAEVEQNFESVMKVTGTGVGRSAAHAYLREVSTGYLFTTTQKDLNWIIENRVLHYGVMDRAVRWQWNKRGSNYMLNILDRLEEENANRTGV